MAYYFHWARGDIFGMTGHERKRWLFQINRIHYEQKKVRDRELIEQAGLLMNLRDQEVVK